MGGEQVFCVQFAFLAPDSDEQYQPGEMLKTKWGTDLAPDIAANISYLLLRYGDTGDADEAAALSHLLHSWTSAPQNSSQLLETNDFRHIAYDIDFHFATLPPSAQTAVKALQADAVANRGPWTVVLTKPDTPQLIGAAGDWTLLVRGAGGKGVGDVPVTVTVTDGTLAGGETTGTVVTPAGGSALTVAVTPTGPAPTVAVELASPADRPVVRQAIQLDTQRVVSTGGEKQLTAKVPATARTAPGVVRVTKTNETTGAGIAGVALRVTAADRTTPAVDQEDKPLVGQDGAALVVVTGADGVADVPNLKTPQEICLTEVAAPPGFDENFDPAEPGSVCGTVQPGATLALKLTNKPNAPTVPVTIPAGDQPRPVAHSTVVPDRPQWALGMVGALVLAGVTLAGLGLRRRTGGRH